MQEGCVSIDPRHARDPAPLSGDKTFPPRSASSFGDSWLACARFRGQRHERRRGCTPARSNSEGPQVVRDREYPFAGDLIVDGSGTVDASLPVLAKVSSLVEALRLGGSYELVHQLWSQFTLVASPVNVDVTWLRDEVLVSGFLCHSLGIHPGFSLLFCF